MRGYINFAKTLKIPYIEYTTEYIIKLEGFWGISISWPKKRWRNESVGEVVVLL